MKLREQCVAKHQSDEITEKQRKQERILKTKSLIFQLQLCSIRKECQSVSIILIAIKKPNYFNLVIYIEFL